MKDWNVVVTVYQEGFRPAVKALSKLGTVERSPYHNVLVMSVDDPVALLEAVERQVDAEPALYDAISRVAPIARWFEFHAADEFEEKARTLLRVSPLGSISEFSERERRGTPCPRIRQGTTPMTMHWPQTRHANSIAMGQAQVLPEGSDLVQSMALMGARINFPRNGEIYGDAEPAEFVYLIITGTVRTSKILADGRRQIGGFYLPGDVFGLDMGDEHIFSAEALSNVTLLYVRRSVVLALADRDGQIARQLWAVTARELTQAQSRILLLIKSAQERIAGFLLEMAEHARSRDTVELSMSRQDIADYLGLTIETVSRTLTALAERATIEMPTARRILLRDRAALEALNW